MYERSQDDGRSALVLWFLRLLHGPIEPYGNYFDALARDVASSAPVRDSRPAW